MIANELRVGNLLNYCGNTVTVMEILKNNRVELGYFTDSIGFVRSLNDENIKSIPLTEEIIEKCGFELYDYEDIGEPLGNEKEDFIILSYRKHKNKYIYYTLDGISPKLFQFIICREKEENSFVLSEITYLHQLQNLYFSLTNEELKIEL